MAKSQPAVAKAASEVKPQIFARGAKEFRSDLFKGDVRKLKKNVAIAKGEVQLIEVDHSHVARTLDSQGRVLEYCSPMGGHVHKITPYMDPVTGELKLQCGPPLKEKFIKTPRGQKRKKVEIAFYDAANADDEGNPRVIRDSHVHVFTYQGSDQLSNQRIKEMQRGDQAAFAAMSTPAPAPKPDDGAPALDDGDTLEEQGD